MEDRYVLLKIKREFTENEAVLSLLKMLKELQLEIGILKSEKEEALDRARFLEAKAVNSGIIKPKKEWLKDELVASQDKKIKSMEAKLREMKKNHDYWQNKYCLLAGNRMTSVN
ncbi:MAG: hypothetical protein ACTHNG_11705 [Ginsengibacter sp.]